MAKIKIVEMNFVPKCPHCDSLLNEIAHLEKGIVFTENIFACPICKKILGIGTSNLL